MKYLLTVANDEECNSYIVNSGDILELATIYGHKNPNEEICVRRRNSLGYVGGSSAKWDVDKQKYTIVKTTKGE